jgi:protein-disulfide isomerase
MVQQLAVPVVLGRDHLRGSQGAVVTLVEYGDYECPHCASPKLSSTRSGSACATI